MVLVESFRPSCIHYEDYVKKILEKFVPSRFRDIQKSAKVQILNDVALIQVVRTRVSFQDSKSENTPKFPSTKILY